MIVDTLVVLLEAELKMMDELKVIGEFSSVEEMALDVVLMCMVTNVEGMG